MGVEGPKNVKLATEIADGWLPMFIPPSRMDLYAGLSFYLGGMGAKAKNFHLELMERMGYGAAAHRVQELFLAGERGEAVAAPRR